MKHESIFILEALQGRHSVVLKLSANIKRNLCWVFLHINIREIVTLCDECQVTMDKKKRSWSCATEQIRRRGSLKLSLTIVSIWVMTWMSSPNQFNYEHIPFIGLILVMTVCFSCMVDVSNHVELLLPSITASAAADLPFPVHSSPLREQSVVLEIGLVQAIGDAQRRWLI